MNESDNNLLTCEACNNPVTEDDDFCNYCGTLFVDEIFCVNHNHIPADGVCVICNDPYCIECGAKTNDRFLCNQHYIYEIFEGMARVHGTHDDIEAKYIKACLEQDGLHPVLFRRHSPYGVPGFKNNIFKAEGDYSGNFINEIKVMVPCQEVLIAEEVLKSINTSS